MSYQHRDLAAGRWQQMSLAEQMANVGSEIERALNRRARDRPDYARRAFERALELMDLTLASAQGFARLSQGTRARTRSDG